MLKQIVTGLLIAGAGAATVHRLTPHPTAIPAPPRPAPPRLPTSYGINLTQVGAWAGDRILMNLAAGGSWRLAGPSGWSDFPPDRIDRDSTVLSLKPGEQAATALSNPTGAQLRDVRVHCTFEGRGEIEAFDTKANNAGRKTLDFVWPKGHGVSLVLKQTEAADPIRHIDCREAGADRAALFDPLFVDSMRPYKVVRFQGWSRVNENFTMDWSRRVLPSAMIQEDPQGVAVEHMVALANAAGVDPWFTLPWNADDTYMANFARIVHDQLDPKRKVYVEMSNETWNYAFAVASQALKEGKAERLDADGNVARMDRYAEKAVHCFKIWQQVFGADRGRIVRVLAGQAVWPDLLKLALDYQNTAHQVDAIAMAPYFGFDFLQTTKVDLDDTDALFRALPAAVDQAAGFMRQDKALADRYGLRLIAYEGGQHLTYDGPNQTVIGRLNRDPRMADIYRRYLAAWDREAGDLIAVLGNVSPISQHAAWGLAEYPGQPMSETPKRRAVMEAIAARR